MTIRRADSYSLCDHCAQYVDMAADVIEHTTLYWDDPDAALHLVQKLDLLCPKCWLDYEPKDTTRENDNAKVQPVSPAT